MGAKKRAPQMLKPKKQMPLFPDSTISLEMQLSEINCIPLLNEFPPMFTGIPPHYIQYSISLLRQMLTYNSSIVYLTQPTQPTKGQLKGQTMFLGIQKPAIIQQYAGFAKTGETGIEPAAHGFGDRCSAN